MKITTPITTPMTTLTKSTKINWKYILKRTFGRCNEKFGGERKKYRKRCCVQFESSLLRMIYVTQNLKQKSSHWIRISKKVCFEHISNTDCNKKMNEWKKVMAITWNLMAHISNFSYQLQCENIKSNQEKSRIQ